MPFFSFFFVFFQFSNRKKLGFQAHIGRYLGTYLFPSNCKRLRSLHLWSYFTSSKNFEHCNSCLLWILQYSIAKWASMEHQDDVWFIKMNYLFLELNIITFNSYNWYNVPIYLVWLIILNSLFGKLFLLLIFESIISNFNSFN